MRCRRHTTATVCHEHGVDKMDAYVVCVRTTIKPSNGVIWPFHATPALIGGD